MRNEKAKFKANPVKYTTMTIIGTGLIVGSAIIMFPIPVPTK